MQTGPFKTSGWVRGEERNPVRTALRKEAALDRLKSLSSGLIGAVCSRTQNLSCKDVTALHIYTRESVLTHRGSSYAGLLVTEINKQCLYGKANQFPEQKQSRFCKA